MRVRIPRISRWTSVLLAMIVSAAIELSAEAQALPYGNLLSLWTLNGNTAVSYGTNGSAFVGTPAYVAGPRPGTQALALANNSYLAASDTNALNFDGSTPFSVTAWIKGANSHGGDDVVIAAKENGSSPFRGWNFLSSTSHNQNGLGKPSVWLINTYGGAANEIMVDGETADLDSTWHHLAFSYDGSRQASGVRIYMDGVDVTTRTYVANNLSATIANPAAFDIGCRRSATSDGPYPGFFNGNIAEVSIWNTALSAANINYIYTNGIHPPPISSFVADNTTILAGQSVMLSWQVDPSAMVSLDNGIGDVTSLTTNGLGSLSVSPTDSTTYILSVNCSGTVTQAQVTVTVNVPPPAVAPPTSNLVAYWPLNGYAFDVCGVHDGIWAGATADNYAPGFAPGTLAAFMDGASYIDAGTYGYLFDANTPFSAAAWINSSYLGSDDVEVLSKGAGTGNYTGWYLLASNSHNRNGRGKPSVWLVNSWGTSLIQVDSATTASDSTWHHVAFTYDGSSKAAGVHIYVDGRDTTTTVGNNSLSGSIASAANLNLGCRDGASDGPFPGYFRGCMAAVSLWNTNLSAQNVAYLVQSGVPALSSRSILLTSPQFMPPAAFSFGWNSIVGTSYCIESSTNLVDWAIERSNYPPGGAISGLTCYTNSTASQRMLYYRVLPCSTSPGLRAEWDLVEGQGANVLDASGYGNDGFVTNPHWIQSELGTALQFSPQTRSCVEIPNSASLNLTDMISLDLYVKTYGTTGTWQGILAKRAASNSAEVSQYQLALNANLELIYGVNVNGGGFWLPDTGIYLNPNQWYHIRADYDALLQTVQICVDGALRCTLNNAPVVQPSSNPVWLGWTTYDSEYLNGELRQVCVIDALAEIIGQLQQQGINRTVFYKTLYEPHQFVTADGQGLRGTVKVIAINPTDQPQSVTLNVNVGGRITQQSGQIAACSRGVLSCVIDEAPTNSQAQVTLLDSGGQSLAQQNLSVPGSAALAGFKAYVISHTHSDFAWHDSIAGCMSDNVAAVSNAVYLAGVYPDFRFCMEHMLAVRAYLARNPDKLDTVRQLMQEGRFEAGGFFTGPWELTASPEGLVRELYLGKLWVQNTLGVEPLTVWNVDLPGHTAQLPQILDKAGIKGLVCGGVSGPSLLNWQARDGSSVPTWGPPWGYGAGAALGLRNSDLTTMIAQIPQFMAGVSANAAAYNLPRIAFIADGSDCESPSAQTVQNVELWNSQNRFPPIQYASTADLFAAAAGYSNSIPAASGEMPSWWDAVQPQGNACFMLDRQLDGRVLAAEKLSAFCSVLNSNFSYPYAQVEQIWSNRLYTMDHNWGGSHGQQSDDIKTAMIQTADQINDQILNSAFTNLAGAIQFNQSAGTAFPLLVFNPLSWERQDIASCVIPAGQTGQTVALVDSLGQAVPCQITQDGASGTNVTVVFQADVPSLGYATYYATWSNTPASGPSPFTVDTTNNIFGNSFYQVQIDPLTGGIKSILDKRSGQELVQPGSKFAFNELVGLEDRAVDINCSLTGKQWLSRAHPSTISVAENGPVRLVIEVSGQLLTASSRLQQIILYAGVPKIDFVTTLDWAGETSVDLYQEFPLNVTNATLRYAVPYGWQQYGSELPYATMLSYPYRGVRGWIEMSNAQNSVTLASQCNFTALKDVSTNPAPGFLIQPLLMRTVNSCGDGSLYYTQVGAHDFHFALQAQADSTHLGEELDSPLLARVVTPPAGGTGPLPDRLSFLSVKGGNVHVAVVKKAEDGQGLILRLVETKQTAQSSQVEVDLFRPLTSATRTSIIEKNQQAVPVENGAVTLSLAPSAIETLRIGF